MSGGWRRWWWLLFAVPLAGGLARLRFDTEVLNLLPDAVPVVRGLQLSQRHFANARELVITLRAADGASAEAAARLVAEHLERKTNLISNVAWQPPWIERPDQTAELIAYLWLNQPPEALAGLADRLEPGKLEAVARATREQLATSMSPAEIGRLSYDPFGLTALPAAALEGVPLDASLSGFASPDGTFRVLYAEAREALPNYRACAAWMDGVRGAVDEARQAPGWPGQDVAVRYTGSPAFVSEIASSMAGDLRFTVLTTLALIMVVFWWAHRSWRPLGLLVVMLALVMVGALAAGGLAFGTLNAVSLGFGAILLGLAVDCGLVVYQEAAAEPHAAAESLRRVLVPSVAWSALTTAAAFLLLNFAGLPGLSQLGTIVGIGVLLAPVVMLHLYLPLVLRWLRQRPRATEPPSRKPQRAGGTGSLACWRAVTVGATLAAVLLLAWARPALDRSNRPLEPNRSGAQAALEELQRELSRQGEPLLLVVSGPDERAVAARLESLAARLANARAEGVSFRALLPNALWPHPDHQASNRVAAGAMAGRGEAFRAAAAAAGFTPEALGLTERVLAAWGEQARSAGGPWPTNESAGWFLKRAAAWTGDQWLAAGALYAGTNGIALPALAARLDPGLPGVWLTGWPLLGESLFRHVERRIRWLVMAIVLVVGLCLRLAFRRWTEVVISFGALGFMVLLLLALMGLFGLSWNLMNLAALPLLLGVGVDYIMHVQVALRRHAGDLGAMRRVTGRAILLCAATNVDGFGSNALSNNPGLASLGLVCALGIAVAYVTAVFLVPAWWLRFAAPAACDPAGTSSMSEGGLPGAAPAGACSASGPAPAQRRAAQPSAAYGPGLWRVGLWLARGLPGPVRDATAWLAAWLYQVARPQRLEIVRENLLPVVGGDRAAAATAARRLFHSFARKLIDLWRYEGGAPVHPWVRHWTGRERLDEVLARGHGVLLVTVHLGNWEFGAPFLKASGVSLLVVTQPEPGEGFTELRQASRARWGIETLVVRNDPFAFVEIIKRLQAGAVVALLLDRPPPPTAVRVELFGRPLDGSVSAALLARATGAGLLPVYIVREAGGYAARILPEVTYDRAALGSAAARQALTQEILRAFEPIIRQYPDQWYHFVPIWPAA